MIKINLLPEVKRKKAEKKKVRAPRQIPYTWIVGGLVALLLTAALLTWNYTRLIAEQSDMKREISSNENKISELKAQQLLVEQARRDRNTLAQKLEVIANLKRRQTGPVLLLDQLAQALPPRLWLSQLNENNTAMSLSGYALDHRQIALFMENLKKSTIFTNIELINTGVSTASVSGEQVPVKSYELSAQLSYQKTAAAPEPGK